MKKKYGFMILLIGLVVGLVFCFSSGVQGVARADDSAIRLENGSYTLDGGTITGHDMGVQFFNPNLRTNATFTMNGGEIIKNFGFGGCHLSYGKFIMNKGTIAENETTIGGGINAAWTTIQIHDGAIINNVASCNGGGGLFLQNAYIEMAGGIISGNKAVKEGTKDYGGGGGVYLHEGSNFVMTGGEISGNTAERGSAIYVNYGTFKYAGGIIEGEIALTSSATFVIAKEPKIAFDIYFISDPTDGKIAKLEGIDTIDLSKINLTSHPDAQLSIREIDGEKWVVMGATRTITIAGDSCFHVITGKYTSKSSIPTERQSELAQTLTLQVPDGTIIKTENYDISKSVLQIGDTYVSIVEVVHTPYGLFRWWDFYEGSQQLKTLPITVKADMRIVAFLDYEPHAFSFGEAKAPPDSLARKEKSNEYYVENKKTTIRNERKSRG